MRTRRLFAMLAIASLGFAGLVRAENEIDPEADRLAREIVHADISEESLAEMHLIGAQTATNAFLAKMQVAIKREATQDEHDRLLLFYRDIMREIMPYSAMEDLLVPIVTKNLSLDDLREIKRFGESPAGRRLRDVQAQLMREAKAGGGELARRKMADKAWSDAMLSSLKKEFPQWFQDAPDAP